MSMSRMCRQLLSHVDGNFHISERWRELGASLTVVHRIRLYGLWNYTNLSKLKPETKAHEQLLSSALSEYSEGQNLMCECSLREMI